VRDRELVTSQNPFSNDAFSRLYVAALADYHTRGSLRQPSALN
jgi:putative intracellular protease/amidase